MTSEVFNQHLQHMQAVTVDTLMAKAAECDNIDINSIVPPEMQGKFSIADLESSLFNSFDDIYYMIKAGKTYAMAQKEWEENIQESIKYLFLLWALIHEEY